MKGLNVSDLPTPSSKQVLEELLSIEEVARLLGFSSTSSVRKLVCRGELRVAARASRNRAMFFSDDVLELIQMRAIAFDRQRSGRQIGQSNGSKKRQRNDNPRHQNTRQRGVQNSSSKVVSTQGATDRDGAKDRGRDARGSSCSKGEARKKTRNPDRGRIQRRTKTARYGTRELFSARREMATWGESDQEMDA